MNSSKRNPKVDAYLDRAKKWQAEVKKLRGICLGCGLTEELKWGKPCYSFQNSNMVVIMSLKDSCAFMYCKGALLKDAEGILSAPGENSQSGRWIKFTSVREIAARKPTLAAYIREAIEAEKSGRKVTYKKITEFKIPDELQRKLDEIPALKTAYHALTPGRQRGYMIFVSSAKQSKTREARVEKCMPRILSGKGLNDD